MKSASILLLVLTVLLADIFTSQSMVPTINGARTANVVHSSPARTGSAVVGL